MPNVFLLNSFMTEVPIPIVSILVVVYVGAMIFLKLSIRNPQRSRSLWMQKRQLEALRLWDSSLTAILQLLTYLFPMHPFSAPWKGLLIFQGLGKGCIGNKWVNYQKYLYLFAENCQLTMKIILIHDPVYTFNFMFNADFFFAFSNQRLPIKNKW